MSLWKRWRRRRSYRRWQKAVFGPHSGPRIDSRTGQAGTITAEQIRQVVNELHAAKDDAQ